MCAGKQKPALYLKHILLFREDEREKQSVGPCFHNTSVWFVGQTLTLNSCHLLGCLKGAI